MTKDLNKNKKSKKYLIYILVLWAVSLYSGITGDVIQSMVIAAIGGGLFAAVCGINFKVWTVLLMTVIPPIGTYYLTRDINSVILSMSFFPVGAAIFWGMAKKLSRSQTIVRSVGVTALYYAAVYSNHVFALFGKVSGETIVKYIDLNLQYVRLYLEYLREFYVQMKINVEQFFPAETIEKLVLALKVSWLGYGIAIFGVIGFVGTVIAKRATVSKTEYKKDCEEWQFVFSKAGAIVFILAYLAGGLYSPETEGLYFPLAINAICIGMYPAVLYMGFIKVWQKFRSSGRMFFLIIAMIAFSFGNFAKLLLVIIGLYSTLTYSNSPKELSWDSGEKKD